MIQVTGQVISKAQVARNVCLLEVRTPELAAASQPGQFVMVRCGDGYDPLLRRPLSIHRAGGEHISLLFRVVGQGTQWLSQRNPEDPLDLLGPLGHGFTLHPGSHNLLLVAGGIGIAPLVSLAENALAQGKAVTLLQGASTGAELYPAPMLPSGIILISVTEDGSAGEKGLVTDHVPRLISKADQLFACGPLPMYRTLVSLKQIRDRSVQVSLEARMGCGLGVCYGCTVKTKHGMKQVCRDGPVFELHDISWEEMG